MAQLDLVRPMRTLLVISFGCLCLSTEAAEPPGSQHKEPYWSRATFAMYSGGQPNLQIIDVTRNGDELFANLVLSNSTYEKRVPPPIRSRELSCPMGVSGLTSHCKWATILKDRGRQFAVPGRKGRKFQ